MLDARRRVSSVSGPSWIFAHIQLAGKGRRGRVWVDPTGNFACTCIFFPDRTIDEYALSSFTAALSLYDCLSDFTKGGADVSIKWPNDILLNQKKVAGILLETIAVGKNKIALSIGFGVNLLSCPGASELEESALSPTSYFIETGVAIDPIELLNNLAANFSKYENALQDKGFTYLRSLLMDRIHGIGSQIIVRTTNETLKGVFSDINMDGHLILQSGRTKRAIAAADIYFD